MTDNKTFKEILIKLSNNQIKEYENKNFSSNSLISNRDPNCFGATFSMENCISYMLVQDKEIIIKNIRTINVFQKSSNQNYITFSHILLNNTPIKNIFPLYFNQKEFLLIVFTKNNIQTFTINIDFNNPNKKSLLNCNFNKNILNITNQVEFCGKTKENNLRFSLGCENGKVYIVDLMPDYDNYELIVNKVKEIGFINKGFLSYITSSFLNNNTDIKGNKNINNNSNTFCPINSLNYLGNNIIAILRNNYLFELININTGYIFYSYYLYDNIDNKEFINDSKIVSTIDESFTSNDLNNIRRKIFYIFIYINSHNINSLISFQLMFVDIPIDNISCTTNDFNYFYSNIDIGTNVKLNNRNNILIYGEIIDMIINNNKLWLLFLNKKEKKKENLLININNNDINDNNFLNENYSLKIINIFENNNNNDNDNEFIDNNDYFNYYDEEPLVDFNEKNLFYLLSIINQLGYNLNNNNNISKNNDIDDNNYIILQQNNIIFSCLLNEKYFLTENIINFVNDKFHTEFTNKKLCYKYLEDKYLNNKNNINEISSIINDIIIPLIQKELYMNNIICLGSFKNNDIDSVSFIRQKELSFINVVDSFEKMNDYIKEYEYQIRKLNSNELLIKEYIHSNLINKNQNNIELYTNTNIPLYLIFALNRIYLTEINLKTKNEKYLEDIFNNKNLEQFKTEIIMQNLSCQMNPYNNLEFIHELINEIYTVYKDIIEENIKKIFNMFISQFENIENDDNYKKMIIELQNINKSNSQEINTININNKYCEIITKIILSRVEALYNIANDIFCFKQWLNLYEDIINVEIPLNIDENIIDSFYIKNLILYIFCNHLTTFNTEVVSKINIEAGNDNNNDLLNDKIITWLEKFIFNKLSQLGYDILNEQKNKFINYAICLILKDLFPNNDNNNYSYSNIIKELVNNKDYQLLNIYNLILINSNNCININIRDALKLIIISNALNGDISKMKDNLILLYQKYPKYDSDNNKFNNQIYINNIKNNYLQLRNYLNSPNMHISQNFLKNFYSLNYDLLINKFLLYLENKDNEIEIEIDNNNEINNEINADNIIYCIINIIGDIIDNNFEENEDICFIIYSKIENLINNSKNDKNLQNIYIKIKNEILIKLSNKIFNSYNLNKKITSSILKLSKLNQLLLFDVCQLIQKNLVYNKNDENNDNNIKNKNNVIENKIEIYYFLNICYTSIMQYEYLIKCSKKFIEILDIYINIENFSIEELIYFYNQKIFALKNEINSYYKKKQLNSFILEDENELDKINKDKIITEIKIEILKYYAYNKKEYNEILENEILKIKNDNTTFLDYIFEFNILKEVIESNLVKCLNFNEAKLFIYNLLNNLEYDINQKTNEQSKLLELFIKNIYMDNNRYNDEYMFITLEILIRLNHSYLNSNNFEKILKTLEHKNKIRLQELLYSLTLQK